MKRLYMIWSPHVITVSEKLYKSEGIYQVWFTAKRGRIAFNVRH